MVLCLPVNDYLTILVPIEFSTTRSVHAREEIYRAWDGGAPKIPGSKSLEVYFFIVLSFIMQCLN